MNKVINCSKRSTGLSALLASILLLLLFLAPAAHAQRMLEPSEFLQDSKFKPLYFKALGPKSKTPWLAKMDGPAPTTRKVQVDGNESRTERFLQKP